LPSDDGKNFTEPLPSNDRKNFTELLPSNDRKNFTELLPSNDRKNFNEPLLRNDRGEGFMMYTTEMGLDAMLYIPNLFIKSDSARRYTASTEMA
jgi:hypothetical protein